MEILPGTYDYNQVVISVLVAILASYVTFDLIGIAWNEKKRKNHQKWLVVSASVLGVGIWTMHFIGMFSYRLPIPVHYELIQTVISLFMAIIGNYFGFLIINKHHDIFHQGLASSLMGAGIVGMHYTGMKAMHIQADMHSNFTLILLSIFIAVSVSWVALRLFINLHSGKIVVSLQKKLMIACVMGAAISGMHYTSMTATHFTSSDHTFSQMNGVMIGGDSIFAAIVFSSVLLILTGIFLAKIKIGLTEQFAKELGLMRINERQLRSMIENSPDAFFVHDSQGKILDSNKAACKFLGYTHGELLSATAFDFEVGVDTEKLKMWSSFKHGHSHFVQGVYKRKDGTQLPVDINLTYIKDENKNLIFALARDMTETEKLKSYLYNLAMTDELTEIFNRRAFMEVLNKAKSRAERNDSDLSVLMIDIDHFKKINDTYGHDIGDLALKHFVSKIEESLRKEDVIGRIGGEEFCVLLADTNLEDAHKLADRMRRSIENTFIEANNSKILYTVSIGLACLLDKNIAPKMLLKNADAALYKAKENGRNRIEIFTT